MHHAYLYTDNAALTKLPNVDPADLVHETYERLPIDAVRELTRVAHLRPVGASGERVLIVETVSITVEAQNALLKLLEEPPVSTTIHMVVADQTQLLPTLLSRFEVVAPTPTSSTHTVATAFLMLSYQERIAHITERTKEKDTVWQRALLTELETVLTQTDIDVDVYRAVMFTESRITRPGASPKMLLEHLALSLPVLK